MCYQNRIHPQMEIDLLQLMSDPTVTQVSCLLLTKMLHTVHAAQAAYSPAGFRTVGTKTRNGNNVTIHVLENGLGGYKATYIVDDKRTAAGHCLNVVVIDCYAKNLGWVLYSPDPQIEAADRAL